MGVGADPCGAGFKQTHQRPSDRKFSQAGYGCHNAADFSTAAQAADGGITRMGRLTDVVQQFVTMIESERKAPMPVAGVQAPLLLLQQSGDNGDHVD
jgi:hypothetical protein